MVMVTPDPMAVTMMVMRRCARIGGQDGDGKKSGE